MVVVGGGSTVIGVLCLLLTIDLGVVLILFSLSRAYC